MVATYRARNRSEWCCLGLFLEGCFSSFDVSFKAGLLYLEEDRFNVVG